MPQHKQRIGLLAAQPLPQRPLAARRAALAGRRLLGSGAGRGAARRAGRDQQRHAGARQQPPDPRRRALPPDQRRSPGSCRRRSSAGSPRVGQDVVLGLREDLFDHLTTLSLRYFSQQKAGWIIARLTSDVDALSDVLSQGLTTLVVNTLTLVAGDRRALHPRLAAGARRARDPAADAHPHALVPGAVARGVPARARDDRGDDRADRGIGLRHGRDPGLQPRARVPRRVRRRRTTRTGARTPTRSG